MARPVPEPHPGWRFPRAPGRLPGPRTVRGMRGIHLGLRARSGMGAPGMSRHDLTRYEVLFGKANGSAGYAPGDITITVDAPDEQTALVLAGVQLGERMPYGWAATDRKSTRLNSSHVALSR